MTTTPEKSVQSHLEDVPTTAPLRDEVAAAFVDNTHSQDPITAEEEAAVRRKLDWILMPLMGVTVALNLVDKGIYGTAAVFGMLVDLDLEVLTKVGGKTVAATGRYSTASSAFYWGYVIGAYPLARLSQRFPIAKMAAIYTFLWGVCLICTPAVKSYHGAVAQRVLLGFLESGVLPAYTNISAMWYTHSEQSLRIPVWYSLGFLGLTLSYFINYGLVKIVTHHLKEWQILFIFWGAFTILWSSVAFFFLPDSQLNARFLSPREKYIAVERLRGNQDSIKNHHFVFKQALEALTDYRVYLIGFMMFVVNTINSMGSIFLPLTVKSMGFNSYQAILLSAPTAVVAAVYGVLAGYICQRWKGLRTVMIAVGMIPCLISTIILWKISRHNHGASLFAVWFLGTYAGVTAQVLALAPSNIAGSTKKSTAIAMVFLFYCCGNIASPYIFQSKQAPLYLEGFHILLAMVCVMMGLAGLYRLVCTYENKRRDGMGDVATRDHAFEDLSDKENVSFRYSL